MSELRELYQEMILDHGKNPRNCHALEHPTCSAKGHNPLCGDRLELFVKTAGGTIEDISFTGAGCAISTASASTMTGAVKGLSFDEANALFDKFHKLLTGDESVEFDEFDPLSVFRGVSEFPMRVKCATLAWHTLQAALANSGETAKTE